MKKPLLSLLLAAAMLLALAVPAFAADSDFAIEGGVLTRYEGSDTAVVIPGGVTSIGPNAFWGCRDITSVTIPDTVTIIGDYAFSGCAGLAGITIPDSVTAIGAYSFSGCAGLTDVKIPDGVAVISDYLFSGCTGLTSVTIPEGVTRIGSCAFWGCESLLSAALPGGITEIGWRAFSGCSDLTSAVIPDQVTSIGSEAFSRCTMLDSVSLPGDIRIGDRAFHSCPNLTIVDIGGGSTVLGENVFGGCDTLTTIWIDPNNTQYTSVGGVVFDRTMDTLVTCPGGLEGSYAIPSGVTKIGRYAFRECGKLTAVTIPESVTSIGNYAFFGCTGLTQAVIPDTVTEIGWSAFEGCTGLTAVSIPGSVTRIDSSAFSGCTALSGVVIPASVSVIYAGAFEGCAALKDVYYAGTQAQWSAIQIGEKNLPLRAADIHYGSTGPVLPDPPTAPDLPALTPIPASGVAFARPQNVLLDGKLVEFQYYALQDEAGNATNFIKLRDLASLLNGTDAQFQVGWDGEQQKVVIFSHTAYTPVGGEGTTPFSGNQQYQADTNPVLMDGKEVPLTAFRLFDANGNAYTYFKLRDLGQLLNFNVGWDGTQVVVETDKPYSGQ